MSGLLLNGVPPTADELRGALVNYGHFTSMQVRDGAVRGLDLHLERLRVATRELFGSDCDTDAVRAAMRDAVAQEPRRDCSLRVTVFSRQFDFRRLAATVAVEVLIAAGPALEADDAPWRVRSVRYERTLPHLKHVGTFPLFHHARQARAAGFDDVLFVDGADRVSEGSIWNIGFWTGRGIVWPEAPALRGTCERLLQAGLAEAGVPQATRPVALAELAGFAGAFAANSRGVMRIGAVDAVEYGPDEALQALLAAALASQPSQDL